MLFFNQYVDISKIFLIRVFIKWISVFSYCTYFACTCMCRHALDYLNLSPLYDYHLRFGKTRNVHSCVETNCKQNLIHLINYRLASFE